MSLSSSSEQRLPFQSHVIPLTKTIVSKNKRKPLCIKKLALTVFIKRTIVPLGDSRKIFRMTVISGFSSVSAIKYVKTHHLQHSWPPPRQEDHDHTKSSFVNSKFKALFSPHIK